MGRHSGQPSGTFRISSYSNTKNATTYVIRLPSDIAAAVPEGTLFKPEFVEEGILLRRVVPDTTVPKWVEERRET